MTQFDTTTSTDDDSTGNDSSSPNRNSTSTPSSVISLARARARSNIALVMSTPSARPRRPFVPLTFLAARNTSTPAPHPRSSTLSPGFRFANDVGAPHPTPRSDDPTNRCSSGVYPIFTRASAGVAQHDPAFIAVDAYARRTISLRRVVVVGGVGGGGVRADDGHVVAQSSSRLMTRDDDDEGRVLDALRADAREKDAWRLGHDRRVRESTRSDAIGRDRARIQRVNSGLTTVVVVAQLIDALRASGAKTLERCANAANAIDRAVLDGERASCDVASVSCEFRISTSPLLWRSASTRTTRRRRGRGNDRRERRDDGGRDDGGVRGGGAEGDGCDSGEVGDETPTEAWD